jgi:glycosyltransferase involved in cell wall biosynthesis
MRVASEADDQRIHIIHHTHSQGGASAKNTGINASTSDIVAFLDDDDLYAPEYLARAVGILVQNPDLDVIFMGVTWFGAAGEWGQRNYDETMAKTMAMAKGKATDDQAIIIFGENLIDALLESVPMAFQRPVVRKRVLEHVGVYRPDCLLWDCEWAITASLKARTGILQEGLYFQRADGQGFSSRSDRRLEHLESGIDIMDRLLDGSRRGLYSERLMPKFREASARSRFNLAWYHYLQHNRVKAIRALWSSEIRKFSLPNLRLLVRLMIPGYPH